MVSYKDKNVPFGYFALDASGLVLDANLTFLTWLGYDKKEWVHTNIEESLSVSSKMIFHSFFFLQLQLNGRVDEVNLTIKTKDGVNLPILLMGYREEHESKETIHCVAVKMTKRDDYEKELRDIKTKLEESYKSKKIALRKENELRTLLESTLSSIAEGIIVTNLEGKITLMNTVAEKLTSWSSSEAYGQDINRVFRIIDMDSDEELLSPTQQVLEKGIRLESPTGVILRSRNGTDHFISGTASTILSDNEEIQGVVIAFRDITKEYLQEKEIDSFLNVNLDMLSVSDLQANFYKVNDKFEEVLGYSSEELIGQSYLTFIHPDDIASTLLALEKLELNQKVSEFVNRYRCKDGTYKYIEWQSQMSASNYIYSSARDVTEKKEREEKLTHLSYHDQLTGLHNRQFLHSIIDDEMKRSDTYRQKFTMAILDLDRFKNVNDNWGHPIGDELLKLTADTIQKNIRNADLLFRFGGEEFLILMPATNLESAKLVLEKIRQAVESINHPMTGRQTISIGTAERLAKESFMDWYQRTDEALYEAKNTGRNRLVSASISDTFE